MLKFTIDTLDGVNESFHELYTKQEDGTYKLTGVDIPDNDTEALKGALEKERKAAEEERQKRKKREEELKKLEMQKMEESKDIEGIKRQMAEQHAAQLEEFKSKLDLANKELVTQKIDNAALDAIAKERGISALLLPYVKGRTRLSDNGGVEVLNDKGEPMVKADGAPVSISEFVGQLKASADFAGAFQGTTHSGGGTKESAGGAKQQLKPLDKITSGLQKMRSGQ